MTATVAQAEQLIELAQAKKKVLLVDHTFVYTGAVRKIKDMIDKWQLGDLIYYDSTRVNLGLFQQDVNVHLGPGPARHIDHGLPHAVPETRGFCHRVTLLRQRHRAEVAADRLHERERGRPHQRELGVAGEDPPDPDRRDIAHGALRRHRTIRESQSLRQGGRPQHQQEEVYHLKVQYRAGDMYAPKLEDHEALSLETRHFVECINKGREPLTGGKAGLEMVKVLVAAEESLKMRGAPVELK